MRRLLPSAAAAIGLGVVAAIGLTLGASSGAPSRRLAAASAVVRPAPGGPRYAVGERVITFVDRSRTVTFPGRGPEPRTLVTVVRYPVTGSPGRVDLRNAPPDRAAGPFPLVVFGHGFAVTPATYYRLLHAWAQAGYVVAAPVFPRENANAPGGPDEADLINQPRDVSVVISGLLAANASRGALLRGTIEPREVAVSGQSDGGETALAVAYDRSYRDRRVRAAVILSGAQIPSVAALAFGRGEPALLAAQGTADQVNRPANTYAFFALAQRPKFLLTLLGAPHLPPYTDERPQLGIVERVTIAFLDRYLKGDGDGLSRMRRAGDRRGVAELVARP